MTKQEELDEILDRIRWDAFDEKESWDDRLTLDELIDFIDKNMIWK
jgi:hypothetical protein